MSTEFETDPDTPSSPSRNWAMGAHLAGLVAGYVVPLGGILAPMVIWMVKRDEDEFVGDQALEAMNFQITMTLAALISIPLMFVVVGFLTLAAVIVLNVVLSIIAAIAATEGRRYRYPWTLRLVSPSS